MSHFGAFVLYSRSDPISSVHSPGLLTSNNGIAPGLGCERISVGTLQRKIGRMSSSSIEIIETTIRYCRRLCVKSRSSFR